MENMNLMTMVAQQPACR